MEDSTSTEEFVRLLTDYQHRLYGLIVSLLPDPEVARDVLQETNVVLWRKASEFQLGTDFGAWAAKVASLQVLAYRTKQARDRHRFFDDALFGEIFAAAEPLATGRDRRTLALENCLQRLAPNERALLQQRYSPGGSVQQLAAKVGKSAGTLRVLLFRLRHSLMECIERKLAAPTGDEA